MQPKQALGQNFLMHQATADRIADSAGLAKDSVVLEIGPGTGMLTQSLLERAGRVVAVEADSELVPGLKERFSEQLAAGTLELIEGDIRKFALSTLPNGYVVVANIPYYITGDILRFLLGSPHRPSALTLLVQKEVAERIARSKKASILSLSVAVYGTPKYMFTVPRGAFRPAPNVDSAVLQVRDIRSPFASDAEERRFFAIVHAGFAHKRKRMAKNLEDIAPSSAITVAFEEHHLDPNARAEDVPLSVWVALAHSL